jgi:CHAT domain-containing protein/pterin-4a-carbinolamine dehydratase
VGCSAIGDLYYQQYTSQKTIAFFNTNNALQEKWLSDNNPITTFYKTLSHYIKKYEIRQKVFTTTEAAKEQDYLEYTVISPLFMGMASYGASGGAYYQQGEYEKALKFYQRMLFMLENTLGKRHATTAKIYNNIAVTYSAMGNYPKSLEFNQKALAVWEIIKSKNHPSLALAYNNMATLYGNIGNHQQALALNKKALKIRQKSLPKAHPDIAQSYNNIASAYSDMKNYPQALTFNQQALALWQETRGNDHPDTALSYNNIATVYMKMGNAEKALSFSQQALALREKYLGKEHPDIANSYNNIAIIYGALGDYAQDLLFAQKALQIWQKALGERHPDTALSYKNIAIVYKQMKNYPAAYQAINKAFTIFLQQRKNNFTILSTQQKEQYLKNNNGYIEEILSISHYYQLDLQQKGQQQAAKKLRLQTINSWLVYKGSILESENRLLTFAHSSKDPAIKKKYQQLIQRKKAYAKLSQSRPKRKADWERQLEQQEQAITTLQYEISQQDPRFKQENALQKITVKTIANYLKPDELYIDYGKIGQHYVIFTITHEGNTRFNQLTLKDSKIIDQHVASFANAMQKMIYNPDNLEPFKKQSQQTLTVLYGLLTNTFRQEPSYAQKTNLIISPDGALRLLPFEALYDEQQQQYFIEQKNIRYIASGKELVRLFRQRNKPYKASKRAILFANPDFDKAVIPQIKPPAMTRSSPYSFSGFRGFRGFGALKGTEDEALAIKKILSDHKTIHYYQHSDANEANLLKTTQTDILHIATHGFFNGSSPNPMLQSGLILAGANYSIQHKQDEGIVTALKLSGLQLQGTHLVVLSACETGKVNPESTTAVSGLTKAFIQAGAKMVVMSLWSVADKETADLMKMFYQNSKNNQGNYPFSLKQSKLKMIKDGLHPYYWAGFVLSGL